VSRAIARFAVLAVLVSSICAVAPSVGAREDSLRDLAARRGFYVGAAVNTMVLARDEKYRETLAREFNCVVAENTFKFERIHPRKDGYDFAQADALAEFAAANGMKLRGHTLVWHKQLPAWLEKSHPSRDEAIAIMRDHIQTLVTRYKGKVWAWDVVNEAIEEDGSGMRKKSFWYETIGPDFVEMAFRFAREADPDVILYYNDYENEGMDAKGNAVYELVRDLKKKGVPVDGVGWQMHVENGFKIGDVHRENARRLVALGLELSMTEVDVRMKLPATPAALETQAATYADIARFALTEPGFKAFVTWGFTDKFSWIPGWYKGQGAALPFDAEYGVKPAYRDLRETLAKAP
jgi:endo-1,4-beta-xylanase